MKNIFTIVALVMLVSCSGSMGRKLSAPVKPEELIDKTTEQVSFSTSSVTIVADLAEWIKGEKPSRAEVTCQPSEQVCGKVVAILNKNDIPFAVKQSSGDSNDIVLLYDSLDARDCSNIASEGSTSNFGCASSSNMLNMIGDYKQVVEPETVSPAEASLYKRKK